MTQKMVWPIGWGVCVCGGGGWFETSCRGTLLEFFFFFFFWGGVIYYII
jgi:hypothetical protein